MSSSKSRVSFLTWKRMIVVRSMAEDQIHWILNNGSADFWFDNWLGTGALFRRVDVSAMIIFCCYSSVVDHAVPLIIIHQCMI